MLEIYQMVQNNGGRSFAVELKSMCMKIVNSNIVIPSYFNVLVMIHPS